MAGSVCACVTYLGKRWHQDAIWEEVKPTGSLMLWAMLCWETLGPANVVVT